MPINAQVFLSLPDLAENLKTLKKEDLLALASHFQLTTNSVMKKSEIRELVVQKLIEVSLIEEQNIETIKENEGDFHLQLEMKKLDMQMQREDREFKMQMQREKEDREFKMQMQKDQREFEFKKLEMEKEIELEKLKVQQGRTSQQHSFADHRNQFDASKNIRLVPRFMEKSVDKYFPQFEKVAENLKWPKETWTTLLQSVLQGKAAEVYSAMSVADSSDYEKVKTAILKAYELVPEAYRQRFRNYKKSDQQTYVEFSRQQEDHFDQWLRSKDIGKDFNDLRQLILIEQFKSCLFSDLKTHIDDKDVTSLNDAAILSDSYTLTHKKSFSKSPGSNYFSRNEHRNVNQSAVYQPNKSHHLSTQNSTQDGATAEYRSDRFHKSYEKSQMADKRSDRDRGYKPRDNTTAADQRSGRYQRASRPHCAYCDKPGHIMSQCFKNPNAENRPIGLVSENKSNVESATKCNKNVISSSSKVMEDYKPYLSEGFCSLNGSNKPVPIQILRDTGASQTLILEGTLPFSEESATGKSALLQVVHLGTFNVPLHQINLQSKFISGPVTVGISPSLPIKGISLLLGNDLASGKDILCPIVSEKAQENPDNENLDVYPACAVTRAMAQQMSKEGLNSPVDSSDCGFNLGDTFFSKLDDLSIHGDKITQDNSKSCKKASISSADKSTDEISRNKLINEQRKDPELRDLYKLTVDSENIDTEQKCYYIKDDVLMRKWRPPDAYQNETWKVIHQIVVPKIYRNDILSLAHDLPMSGHMGVSKTYNKILNHFFWGKMKQDVAEYCKSCHSCQMVGKPNQKIPIAPLKPIPAFDEPFSRVLVDCVGPLPKTKSGMHFLLTIMCTSTRFPEAIPLRSIKTRAIVKALTKFFCFVGIPKAIQHDQGTNFMSKIFQQVTNELGVKQCPSTAYHPQSQGALERFHQTLKSMLKKYCLENTKDWDEGVHFALFAAREAVQESLGFSPFELIFGHTVRGPMHLLKEKWLADTAELNLLEYVSEFREKIFSAIKLAQENMTRSQINMKQIYDKNTKIRSFQPGDQVLVFLPITEHSLQAKYFGPYVIDRKINDLNYVVNTPGRRKENRVCHINMIKEYFNRNNDSDKGNSNVSSDVRNNAKDRSYSKVSNDDVNTIATLVQTRNDVVVVVDSCDVDVCDRDNLDSSVKENVQSAHLKNSDYLANLDQKLSHLSDTQKEEVTCLIRNYENLFPDVPTKSTAAEHDVVIMDSQPIKQHPYRLNPIKLEHMRKEIQYMLENDIIETSKSDWSSPCILVPKPDGSYRFVTDFRKVNHVTKTDSFPIPRIDDIIDNIGSATFVSKFDLLKGYWQIPLTQRAKEISAFATPDGLYQYKVMPFGMKCSPATFQRMIHSVLQGLKGCEAYIDDVIIHSTTWQEHIHIMREMFQRLKKANLTVNLAKSEFLHATVEYLGHVVGQGCVKPINAKVVAIANYTVPTTKKELMRFLGMVGFYRKFCHNFSIIVSPLTNLLQKKQSFEWTPKCDTAFNCVKDILMNSPVLISPDFNKEFKLAVDACDVGIGAVLYQESDDNIDKVISYYSKKLNKYQKNYSTIEKECLALLLSLQHFDVYLNVTLHPILVYTDHNPLTFLHKMTNKNQRLTRWSLLLQQYNILVNHIKGTDNVMADALSRA